MARASSAGLALVCVLVGLCSPAPAQQKTKYQREVEECIQTIQTSPDAAARKGAIGRLADLESIRRGLARDATPSLVKALKDKDAGVRAAAAGTLGFLGYEVRTWVKDLAPLLADTEPREVKLAAAGALGSAGKEAGFALDTLTAMREKEQAKAEGTRDGEMLDTLRAAIERIQQGALTLGAWYYIGPFGNEGNKGFKTAYPPEKEIDLKKSYPGKDGATAAWQKGNFTDGEVNNLALFGEKNNTAAVVYLYRTIECERPMEATLSLGSDDTLTVWLNGEQLLNEEVYRAAAADQNKAVLKLRAGTNHLLMKICQGDGDWAFYFRVAEVRAVPGK